MSVTTTPVKRPLTIGELFAIRRAIDNACDGPHADAAAVVKIFERLHPAWSTSDRIRPGDVSIPEKQATRIIGWAAARYDDPELRLHGMLDIWLNKGPSSY